MKPYGVNFGTGHAFPPCMKLIPMTLIALTLSGGVALAEGRGRWRDTSHYQGGTVVTPTYRNQGRARNTDRRYDNHRHVVVQRARPAFRNNRFYFAGGQYQRYQRPAIQYQYRNYYHRPGLVSENMQHVDGYVWSPGQWEWNSYEWKWIPGHYDVDTSDQQSSYDGYDNDDDDNSDYDNSAYDNSAYDTDEPAYYNQNYNNNTYRAPAAQGGIQVQGSWNF